MTKPMAWKRKTSSLTYPQSKGHRGRDLQAYINQGHQELNFWRDVRSRLFSRDSVVELRIP